MVPWRLRTQSLLLDLLHLLLFLDYYLLDTRTLRARAKGKRSNLRLKLVHPAKDTRKGPIKPTVAKHLLEIFHV